MRAAASEGSLNLPFRTRGTWNERRLQITAIAPAAATIPTYLSTYLPTDLQPRYIFACDYVPP